MSYEHKEMRVSWESWYNPIKFICVDCQQEFSEKQVKVIQKVLGEEK